MGDLSGLLPAMHARLDAKHAARERALTASRQAIRHAANAIRAAHRGDREEAAQLLERCRGALTTAEEACADHPDVEHAGFLHDARKEFVEARTTVAVTGGEPLPGPEELGVTDAAYLNGLAETVGELRRFLLDRLRHGDLGLCETILSTMDDVYMALVTIDYPDAITAGLRRSTDVARGILERTRGDYTTAVIQARLQDALERHRRDVLDA